MSAPSFRDHVVQIKNEYLTAIKYEEESLAMHAGGHISNTGFMGSPRAVFLTSHDSIIHEAPGCVAAPLVNMVAKNAISLGIEGQGDQPVPVRLYAPLQ